MMGMAITNERLLGLLAFVVAIALWPSAPGGALVLRWCVLALFLCVMFVLRMPERQAMTPGHICGLALMIWGFASLSWTIQIFDGANEFLQWELVAVPAFLFGATVLSLREVYIGLSLGVSVSTVFAIFQTLGYHPVIEVASPAGLFANRDPMAEIAALIVIGCMASRIWWAVPGPLLAVALVGERTAIAALALTGLAWLFMRHRMVAIAIALFIAIPGGAYVATHGTAVSSLGDRAAFWQDTVDGLTVTGRGIGSFFAAYPQHLDHFIETQSLRPDHAHNDFLEAAFELGIPGALLLAALFVIAIGRLDGPESYVILGLGILCLAVFPLHYPATLFLGALAGGRACRTSPRLCAMLHRLRVACLAWVGSEDDELASRGI
jgi:hypothetical protein